VVFCSFVNESFIGNPLIHCSQIPITKGECAEAPFDYLNRDHVLHTKCQVGSNTGVNFGYSITNGTLITCVGIQGGYMIPYSQEYKYDDGSTLFEFSVQEVGTVAMTVTVFAYSLEHSVF
jgi:hypothetical protein